MIASLQALSDKKGISFCMKVVFATFIKQCMTRETPRLYPRDHNKSAILQARVLRGMDTAMGLFPPIGGNKGKPDVPLLKFSRPKSGT